jgi:hypothetical protein
MGTMMPRILIAAFVLLLACPVLAKPVSPPANRRYVPIYAHKFRPTEKHPRHSLQGDFIWAADSRDLRTAAIRWRSFLEAYGDKELDSAIQARLISIGKYELVRVYYLLGNVEAGDKLWKELDPLKLL